MVEEEIEETYDHWNDIGFVNELQEQENKYRKGKLKLTQSKSLFRMSHQLLRKQKENSELSFDFIRKGKF